MSQSLEKDLLPALRLHQYFTNTLWFFFTILEAIQSRHHREPEQQQQRWSITEKPVSAAAPPTATPSGGPANSAAEQRRHSKPHQSQNHFGVDLKDGPWLFRAAQVDRSWLQLVDRAINTCTKSWLPAIGAKSCFGSLRGDKFFFTTVVLVTISHVLQLPPLCVRAQLRVKPVTLF